MAHRCSPCMVAVSPALAKVSHMRSASLLEKGIQQRQQSLRTTTNPESDDTDDCTLMTAPGQSYCNIVESRGDQYGQFSTWTLPSLCCTTLPPLHILETRCNSDMMCAFRCTSP